MNLPKIDTLMGCFMFLRYVYDPLATPEYDPARPGERVFLLPNGQEGTKEMERLYNATIKAGDEVCFIQIGQTTATETGDQVEEGRVMCGVMIGKKLEGGALAQVPMLLQRDLLWNKALAVMGRIKEAADWYKQTAGSKPDYEVSIEVDRNALDPVGKIANGITLGWYMDVDIAFPVNSKMYPEP